jgi:hypothetical protein
MTLTTAAKNWLAINAGVDNCFSPTGVVYKLPDEANTRTGSTGDVLNAFFVLKGTNPTAKLIADTSYNDFKLINEGLDIDMDNDVLFAYNNDGSGTLSAYCAPPAHVISTELTLDKDTCTDPCTVNATITWTNDGAVTGTFAPGVIVDGGLPITMTTEQLAAGDTVSHTLEISGLTAAGSPHNICASPEGATCKPVYTFVQMTVCNWITSKGGWANIGSYDIMTLIRAYLHIPGSDLGFVVMSAYITGCVLYYLGLRPNGNSFTGCTFAT